MLVVTKFGGSSLASSIQFKKVKEIVLSDAFRDVVVVSAPGKRDSHDNKITDLLYLTYSHIKYHVDFSNVFNLVKERFNEIKDNLNIDINLDEKFEELEQKMKHGISEEELVCKGEYFSALLMSKFLNYQFIDAKDIIFFNYDGKINEEKTLEAIRIAFSIHKKIVVPGFYGSYPDGSICLFSRGGSDVTASYIAKALEANKYENWTDVSGFYMADPKIVDSPKHIKEVTYDELRELSYMGASVLHEETILPLLESNIPLEILNTNKPFESGTIITKESKNNKSLITGITGKKNFIALTFVKSRSADKLKAILKVLNVFDKYQVTIEHIPTSIDSFSVVCEKIKIEKYFFEIIVELKKIEEIISIKEDNDIALIAVVGRNMVTRPGISGKILSVFGKENINIKLLDQGREEINIIIGISNDDFAKSINCLYNHFVGDID